MRTADSIATTSSFPHTRGGGPITGGMPMRRIGAFSPHAWGWTGSSTVRSAISVAFSPHAWGWTDAPADAGRDAARFPHTRGGGPLHERSRRSAMQLVFPTRVGVDRAVAEYEHGARGVVFPTRVGVDRVTAP